MFPIMSLQAYPVLLCLFTCVVILILYISVLNYQVCSYWKRRNVLYYPPSCLVSKDIAKSFLIQFPQLSKIYDYAKRELCCGFFQFRKPTLLIKCPDLINNILTKDFKYFPNKRISECTEGKQDPLSFHLLALNDEKWSHLRAKLTPSFTTDKLKNMFYILEDRVDKFMEELGDGGCSVRESCESLSMDCIAACAFGLELNCIRNENTKFIRMCKAAFEPGFWPLLKAHLRTLHPKIFRVLRMRPYNSEVSQFFCGLVRRLIKMKKDDGANRPDFVSLLVKIIEDDSSNPKDPETATDPLAGNIENVVASQVFSFFVGGFETTSITMSNALFEIAHRQEVQKNIRHEIDRIIGSDDVNYENISKLKFLNCVIKEVLRIHPPVFYIQRVCSKDYKIPGTDIIIEKGMELIIPVLKLHHDPNYFDKPSQFVPERFSTENRDKIIKGSYLPFGDGPRQCIGYRFSLLELKLALCKILRDFELTLDPKTPSELLFEEFSRIYRVKHEILIRFSPRQRN